MSDSDTTPASDTTSDDGEPGKGKWSELPRTSKPLKPHPSDGQPSEYGLPVGMDDHPLRAFYRLAREEDEAEAKRRARAIDARHPTGDAR